MILNVCFISSRLLGGILLVSGSCIGAGMLALPIITGLAGLIPSMVIFLLTWLFMLSTSLLLLEVSLNLSFGINLVTMVEQTLGRIGKIVCWSTFLFLFYCLMVAYAVGSGNLFMGVLKEITGLQFPYYLGSLFFVSSFGIAVYFGTESVDRFNRILMLGLVISYIIILWAAWRYIDVSRLSNMAWGYCPFIIPVTVVGFGFHQLVPTLTTYFQGNERELKKTLVIGSLIPLVVYFFWEVLVLGIVPMEGDGGIVETLYRGDTAAQALLVVVHYGWLGGIIQCFAFFALITSFLGVSLSFVDFLADGLRIEKSCKGKVLLCLMVMLPPFILSLSYSEIFLGALNVAGGIGAAILFGVLPPMMVWKLRYYEGMRTVVCLPGGKKILMLVLLYAFIVILFELLQVFGFSDVFS